jgi:hypothetical protein
MKRICILVLSAASMTAAMALAVDDASAQRRGGVGRIGVGGGGVNRAGLNRVGSNRIGVNRAGLGYRPGLGVAAAGLAIGATASAAYGYGNYDSYGSADGSFDSGYYPTRDEYIRSHRVGRSEWELTYFGPVCNPAVESRCQ